MDRISICEGYFLYYALWHAGGVTRRCERQRRNIAVQLDRMRFRPSPLLTLDNASDEARSVYRALVREHEGEAGAKSLDPMPGLEGFDLLTAGAAPGCRECNLSDEPDDADYDAANEPHFSWTRCDACQRPLGGDRYPAHGWLRSGPGEGEWVHLNVCPDCLQRIAGVYEGDDDE